MDNTKEYILCAAIERFKPKDVKTYWEGTNDIHKIEIGFRHHDIRDRFPGEVNLSPSSQGFYTSKGRFVDRRTAMQIAYECGQVTEGMAIFGYTYESEPIYNDLFSEDLY